MTNLVVRDTVTAAAFAVSAFNALKRFHFGTPLVFAATLLVAILGRPASADEGGASFWLPGQYGSFAALPPDPGFSMPLVSYFYSAQAGGEVLTSGAQVRLGVDTEYFAQFFVPTYAFDSKLWGGQPVISLALIPAYNSVSANVTDGITTLAASDSVTGLSDLYPTFQVFWPGAQHNYMAYVTGSIPVGSYNSSRLSNLGLGHAAIDFGGAYTYLNQATGWEFSATGGVTFNARNDDTGYKNGTSLHVDLATSRFVSEKVHIGLAGFAYVQVRDDDGQPAIVGDGRSRTFGIGPQIGWFFGDPDRPSYANIRAYWEFETRNRVEGQGVFFTLSFPL